VILTYDARVSARLWLLADYLPEVADLDARIFPAPETLARWLGGEVDVRPLPLPRDTSDWMLGSFWDTPSGCWTSARGQARRGSRDAARVVERVVTALRRDLDDGSWDARHGELRAFEECDVGCG
jgi:hypothetical protein